MLDEQLKRSIREANELTDVIQSYGVMLKRAGRYMKGLCPFHNEKTPSFSVNPEGQYYNCFGCGKKGDVFSFVMDMERIEFFDALRILADRRGIALEIDPSTAAAHQKEKDWKSYLYRLNEAATSFFKEMLYANEGSQAREYLKARAIPEESWERFQLGFAPVNGSPLLKRLQAQQAPLKALEHAGLVTLRDDGNARDYFYNRLMFPIQDANGRTIAFGGRVIGEGEPKYLNTRETPLFHKSQTVYGLAQSRDALVEQRKAYLVEGYTDVIMCHQYGLNNVVACLGTAITPEHVRILRRYVDCVILMTDADKAGASASERGIEVLFQEEMPAFVVRLDGANGAKDPCEVIQQSGIDTLRNLLEHEERAFEFKLSRIFGRHDLRSPTGQGQAAQEAMAFVNLCRDPIQRAANRQAVAARLNLPEQALAAQEWSKPAKTTENIEQRRDRGVPKPIGSAAAERELLRWLFHQPAWLEAIVSVIDLTRFRGKVENVIALALLAGLEDGTLPPQLDATSNRTKSGDIVAREVLKYSDQLPNETTESMENEMKKSSSSLLKTVVIDLAEYGPETQRLKPDEACEISIQTVLKAWFEEDLAQAKRELAAARSEQHAARIEAAERRIDELQLYALRRNKGRHRFALESTR